MVPNGIKPLPLGLYSGTYDPWFPVTASRVPYEYPSYKPAPSVSKYTLEKEIASLNKEIQKHPRRQDLRAQLRNLQAELRKHK